MLINLKLNRDFEKALKTLVDEYGEDFEIYYEISKGEFQRIVVKR